MLKEERQKPGAKRLPPEKTLVQISVRVYPDTLLWLDTTYEAQRGTFIRGLIEQEQRREEMAARIVRKSPGSLGDAGEKEGSC